MSNPTRQGSFAQRMSAMSQQHLVENWDEDDDLQGDFFTNSTSTAPIANSSRVSHKSESLAGDEDWQVLLTPNDDTSTQNAISSAKQAGIPIPNNVPSSALLGGSIKRLGKKKSRQKIRTEDDWGEDLDLGDNDLGAPLKLKLPQPPQTPAVDDDSFDDWGEGSLGVRYGGTRRGDARARSSSVSATAMSPSMGSIMTTESEDDDLNGLVLPTEAVDFNARLTQVKLKQAQEEPATPENQHISTTDTTLELTAQKRHAEEQEDFMEGLEFESGEVFDQKKAKLNRNVKIKTPRTQTPQPRPATTLTFTDKPTTSRIPRPMPSTGKMQRLDPVYESGAPAPNKPRFAPTTRNDQLLRLKRSAPALRNNNTHSNTSLRQPPPPFLPAGATRSQSHHAATKSSGHFRRDSDPNRAASPAMRSYSRLSISQQPETPSRAGMRKDIAPASLVREAASKRLFKPSKKRNFGDGTELDVFDDLPTSANKESKYTKQPSNRAPPAKVLRQTVSTSRLPLPDRVQTPAPATPRSPTRQMESFTPRFARDTAASRSAREARIAGTRSRGEGPIAPPTQTNWKAQIAARSPHNSPVQRRKGTGAKPQLIKPMSAAQARVESGMTYNPLMQRWEGNEAALSPFSHPNHSSSTVGASGLQGAFISPTFGPQQFHGHQHSQSNPFNFAPARQTSPNSHSPPRPALISQISSSRNTIQVQGGMVFDPNKMKWLKISASQRNPSESQMSPSVEEEEDPFAGIEELKDNEAPSAKTSLGGPGDLPVAEDSVIIHEEFDLGPEFIRRQEQEEVLWNKRTEGWVGSQRQALGEGWRWAIRELALAAASNESQSLSSPQQPALRQMGSTRALRRVGSLR